MIPISSLPWTTNGTLEVLSFGLGGETLAIEAPLVQEILDLLPETAVPGADPLVGHVINFRGRVIPLADLRPAFGMEQASPTRDSRIVVITLPVGDSDELIGLRADRVNEVTTLPMAACEAPPMIGMRWPRGHVRALVRQADGVTVLPDLHSIFDALIQRTTHINH